MENKSFDFQFRSVCAKQNRPNYKNGATVKYVKRCQLVKNACALTKFWQLRHFIQNFKQDSPRIQLFWNFLLWNLIV